MKNSCCALFECFIGCNFCPISVRCLFILLKEPPDHIGTELICSILLSLKITMKGEPICQNLGTPMNCWRVLKSSTYLECRE